MFKWLFIFWKNNVDSVYVDSKINMWAYLNAKMFKVKISNYIYYFILNLNNLALKSLKIFHKNFSFELIYFKILYIYIFFILILLFL